MLFLGTGGSELIPNPMCSCDLCRQVRAGGDPRDIRVRSALLLDDENLIDCGPDVLSSCIRFGASLEHLKHIFLTHAHSDHFDGITLENLELCATEPPQIKVFMSEVACNGFLKLWEDCRAMDYVSFRTVRWPEFCTFVPVKPFTEYELDGGTFSAVFGRHAGLFEGETSLNYLFRKDGRSLFFATDTGPFFPETYEYLRGKRLDCLVIENAYGKNDAKGGVRHLSLRYLFEVLDRLTAQGTIDSETQILVTHLSHNGWLTHTESDRLLQERYGARIRTAYDGLRV